MSYGVGEYVDKVAAGLRGLIPLTTVCRPSAVEVALHAGPGDRTGGGYRLQVANKPGDLLLGHYRRGMATGVVSCSQPGALMAPVTHRLI
jgi:hypothetical protein